MPTTPENPYASPRGEAELPRETEDRPDSLRVLIAYGMLLIGLLTNGFATFGLLHGYMVSAAIIGTVGLSSLGCGFWLMSGKKRR